MAVLDWEVVGHTRLLPVRLNTVSLVLMGAVKPSHTPHPPPSVTFSVSFLQQQRLFQERKVPECKLASATTQWQGLNKNEALPGFGVFSQMSVAGYWKCWKIIIIQSYFGAFMCKYSKYLTVKDVLWCGLLKLDVPHKSNALWLMRRVFVVVVGGNHQLGVLRGGKKSKQQRGTADPGCWEKASV